MSLHDCSLEDLNYLAYDVAFTIGAEDTNAITVNLQVNFGRNDNDGDALPIDHVAHLDWYLSDDSAGDGVVATAPSGGVAGGTDGAVVPLVTGKAGFCTTESDGDVDFVITETGADTFYLVIRLPNGRLAVSDAITFAT